MSDDIETLRDTLHRHISHIDTRHEALAALNRLEASKAVEGYAQFRAMRRRAEKAESERDALRAKLDEKEKVLFGINVHRLAAERENDRLRAKLEKAKGALEPFANFFQLHPWANIVPMVERARAILAELSADAPAQPQISDEAIYAAQVAYETALRNGVRNAFDRMHAAIAAALEVMERK